MNEEKKPKLNVKLLRKIQKHILKEPERLVMKFQLVRRQSGTEIEGDSDRTHRIPPCGTAACIAGWALILTNMPLEEGSAWGDYVVPKANELLGMIGGVWRHSLFDLEEWPHQFFSQYDKAETAPERAKIAAERIDHLIKTGK